MEPEDQPTPNNYILRQTIQTACDLISQRINPVDAGKVLSLDLQAETANGPKVIDLSAFDGIRERDMISVRRAWWNLGGTDFQLIPTTLSEQDMRRSQYQNWAPGFPMKFATESYRMFLIPAPGAAGTLKVMLGCGIMAPQTDDETITGIPAAFDVSVLYNALVIYCASAANDVEMQARAKVFAPLATEGIEMISAWYNGQINEESQGLLMFDARSIRRWARRS